MTRTVRTAIATVLALGLMAAPALAAWIATGSGTATATATTINAVPTPLASEDGSTVTVGDFATTLANGTAVDHYLVTRHDADEAESASEFACEDLAADTDPLECVEEDVPDGTWVYRVQAVKGSWTATSAPSNTVNVVTAVTPTVTLNEVTSPTNIRKPALSGNAGDAPGDSETVTLKIYEGSTATGDAIRELTAERSETTWSILSGWEGDNLADGTYTAQAEQDNDVAGTGTSATSTFLVDATEPTVTLDSFPAAINQSKPAMAGTAGATEASSTSTADSPTVTVKIYSGTSPTPAEPGQTLTVNRSSDTWSLPQGWDGAGSPLTDGLWTIQAEQPDGAGNLGQSSSRTFQVDTVAPTVSLSAPANDAAVAGGVNMDATATDPNGSGVTEVEFELRTVTGIEKGPWQSIGTATTPAAGATYRVTLDTSALTGMRYEWRAIATDRAGNISQAVPEHVLNVRPRPTSVAFSNGGTANQLDKGDQVTITFSQTMKVSTICGKYTDNEADWSETDTNNGLSVTVNASNVMTFSGPSNCGLGIGSINLGATYNEGRSTTWGSNGNNNQTTAQWFHATRTLVITLGSTAGATGSQPTGVTSPASTTYSPASTLQNALDTAVNDASYSFFNPGSF